VAILSFTSADGYAGIGDQAGEVIRTAWRAVLIQDILLKLQLMIRPYEVEPGRTTRSTWESLDSMSEILARQGLSNKERLAQVKEGLRKVKEAFLAIPVRKEDRPLIGVVGEIFCRLNTSRTTTSSATSRPKEVNAADRRRRVASGTRTPRPSAVIARRRAASPRPGSAPTSPAG